MSVAKVAGGAVAAAGLLIFLNYQFVLVRPITVPADAPAGVRGSTPGVSITPSALTVLPPTTGAAGGGASAALTSSVSADHPSTPTNAREARISALERELAQLRTELDLLRPSRTAPVADASATAASGAPGTPAAVPAIPGSGARSGSYERECPHPCGPNGTCNRATGECSCPPHLRGERCSEPMFPACANMWGFQITNAPCGLPEATFPITCECAAQCDDANLLMRRMCYEHRPPEDPGRSRNKRWHTGASDERWTMTVVDSPAMLQVIHERAEASRATSACNGHGIWMPKLPRWLDPPGVVPNIPLSHFDPNGESVCVCLPTWWGAKCTDPLRSPGTCHNRCTGRGKCVGSVCACDEGYWGTDCSLRVDPAGGVSKLENGAVAPEGSGVTAKVYVYELPGRFTTWLAAQSHAPEWTHSWWFYDNDISLHQRFLASPYRTTDPEEADFFFIPLYRSLGAYTAGWGPGVVTPKGWRAFMAAVGYVNRTWPYFSRNGGRDHMMVITCDVGYGTLGEHTKNGFIHRSVLPKPLEPIKFILQWGGKPTRPGYDLVIPPRTPPQEVLSTTGSAHPYSCAYSRIGPSRAAPRAVTLAPRNGSFFYFRGKIILDNPVYSQGVRQHVYRLHHEREGYVISDKSSKNFYKEMMDARFCFAPTGWGWGQRVFEAILTGCIPVIMQSDNEQPFEKILPWSEFAVMLNESHIPDLHTILAAIPEEKVVRMHRTLSCVWPRLTFFSSPSQREEFGQLYQSDAFQMMMLELSAQLDAAKGGGGGLQAWHNASRMLTTAVCSCVQP